MGLGELVGSRTAGRWSRCVLSAWRVCGRNRCLGCDDIFEKNRRLMRATRAVRAQAPLVTTFGGPPAYSSTVAAMDDKSSAGGREVFVHRNNAQSLQ
jgi:hypothetical protein